MILTRSLKEKILRAVDNLPPMPRIMRKARQIIDDPNSSLKDLADVIEADQALAVKVLRLANSAYYSRPQKVSSVAEASVVLGMKALGELVSVAFTHKVLGGSLRGYDLPADALWRHSLSVAVGSRIVANMTDAGLANEAFSTGLIHDVGKIILDPYIMERNEVFSQFLAEGQHRFLDAEKQILGFDHAEIAAKVCEKWQFPKTITKAIRYHHDPGRFRGSQLAYIVHASDQIAIWSGMDTEGITLEVGENIFAKLGVDLAEVESIMDEVVNSVSEIAEKISEF